MFSWYKYLIVSLVFSHLDFWSGSLFLIAPFPDLCLLVLFCILTPEHATGSFEIAYLVGGVKNQLAKTSVAESNVSGVRQLGVLMGADKICLYGLNMCWFFGAVQYSERFADWYAILMWNFGHHCSSICRRIGS